MLLPNLDVILWPTSYNEFSYFNKKTYQGFPQLLRLLEQRVNKNDVRRPNDY